MAQPNLAREPSMDEILASIRKIIESNETVGPGQPANDQGPLPESFFDPDRSYLDEEAAEEIQLTIDDSVFPDYVDDAIVPQRQPAEPVVPELAPVAPVVPSAPLSLADVAARVRAASERQSAPREIQPRDAQNSTVRDPQPRDALAREPQARDVHPRYEGASSLEVSAEPQREVESQPAASDVRSFEPSVTAPAQSEPARTEPALTEPEAKAPEAAAATVRPTEMAQDRMGNGADAAFFQPAVEPAAVHAAPMDVVKDVPAIVSEAVGDQVARSFGELALALDSSARRSFDEIAEEMLRPMLQEWLDDNLPTLVERLVREEIERVARGPRR